MTFLHPWAIGCGLAAVLVPILIHWLTRPRPKVLPLSTVRFVRRAIQQRRARHRLRDLLILALRATAVLFLAWALARPFFGESSLVSASEAANTARVVLVDCSQSMAAESHGIEIFERARALAGRYVAGQPGMHSNLILGAAAPHGVFDRLSTNFAALGQELSHARPRRERFNVQAALNKAAEMLAHAPPGTLKRELVVISDFQRTNWAAANFSPLPPETRIQLESVASDAPLDNLAVLRIDSQDRAEVGRALRVEVQIGNFSSAPRHVQIELSLGESTYHLGGLCPLGSHTFSTEVIPRSTGWLTGAARLLRITDALPTDNSRSFVLEVHEPAKYALLTRQRAEQTGTSSYYLERALAPGERGHASQRIVRCNPARPDRELLGQADMILIDHPGQLSGDTLRWLRTLIHRGQSLFYVACEPSDAANLKMLAEMSGSEWQLPVEFMPAPTGPPRRDLFISEFKRDQPPFQIFGEASPLIGPLRFTRGLASRRTMQGIADDVLAVYSDRTACLVVSACGAGTVGVLNTDLAASNLPGSPAFVPLICELISRMVRRPHISEAVACGEPIAIPLPPIAGSIEGLKLVGPDGQTADRGVLLEEDGRIVWRFVEVGSPGVYLVKQGDKPLVALAAAAPPEESDLRPIDPEILRGRLAGDRAVQYRAAGAGVSENRDELWTWLAAACACCMLCELLVLKRFRT
jgi:hypothetical protein